MNAKGKAVTADRREVKGPQGTGAAHVTPIEVPQTCESCVPKATVRAQDQHSLVRQSRMQGS